MEVAEVFQIIKRDAALIVSEEELLKKLSGGKRLRVKLGADPSRPDLHLGHSVVLRKLKLLQKLGHEIVFVIGDFTGMIGDPSGRSRTRKPLTFDETRRNGQTYFEQVTKILNPEKTRIVYNSQWLSELRFADILELAGKYTVARVLERDDFSRRFAENTPIGMHEMFYPLMQGYDSVALRADIEVGGSDQTFNLLVGRELQRDYGQAPQDVITFALLPGLDGVEKMSKSLGNYIGIDEPPEAMFEKCMKVPDALLETYFRLTTDIPEKEYLPLLRGDIRRAHFAYAREIVTLYHNADEAKRAEKRYITVASGALPDGLVALETPAGERSVVELLRVAGFAKSNSEARRLIEGGGVRIDGETVRSPDAKVAGGEALILSKGKNKFIKIKFI